MSSAGVGTGRSTGGTTGDAARRAAQGRWVERVARVGLAARGLVYLLMGLLALQIATGDRSEQADQQGALQEIAGQPFGTFVLWVVAVGFVGYALWQLSEALWGHWAETGRKRTAKRVESGLKVVGYGVLAYLAARIAMDGSGGSEGSSGSSGGGESLTARVLDAPGGRWIVGAVGVAIIIGSAILAWRGATADFSKQLSLGSLSSRARAAVIRLGQTGHVARGVVFALFGALAVGAAVTYDPEKARGIDGALKELVSQPYGPALLVVVALGLVCFGVYSFLEVKFRRL